MHHPENIDDQSLANICKALAHPARIRIVRHLMALDTCVCGQIVDVMPLAQSTVSQHLKVLRQAGIVRGEVDGPRTCYCLDRDRLELFRRAVNLLVGGKTK
ncbi:MAG: ArsR/SmtB family transcription factor [Desulfatibacillaceae bacterium]